MVTSHSPCPGSGERQRWRGGKSHDGYPGMIYCLSSAKLRSTDSVNPRAVLSRVRPRYRLYSKHRDRRCWTGPGIGIRVSFRTFEETQLF